MVRRQKVSVKKPTTKNPGKKAEWKETDLYEPVKIFLEKQGYSVSAEVGECDIMAVKDGQTVIVELKTRMSLALVIQGAKRKDLCESVYLAVPVKGSSGTIPSLGGVLNVLKKLSIGLYFVRFLRSGPRVEEILAARDYERRVRRKKVERLHREIAQRTLEYNTGGSRSADKKMTAYRQQTVRIASLLLQHGPLRLKLIKEISAIAKTDSILRNNFYGWFERVSTGIYGLLPSAVNEIQALKKQYPGLFISVAISENSDQQLSESSS
jgi:hypothetical protein